MPKHVNDITLEQIKRASKLTGSLWVAVVHKGLENWEISLVHKLNKKKRTFLDDYLKLKAVETMLEGVKEAGQSKSKKTGKKAEELGVERVYVFGTTSGSVLLVGCDEMDKLGKGLFQNIGLSIQNLQRYSLLNELSSDSLKGLSTIELINRVKVLVGRTFTADLVTLYELSKHEGTLNELGDGKATSLSKLLLDSTLEGTVIRIGQPIRIDNIAKQSKYSSIHSDVQSKLVVPMRFWGELVGVISLESYHSQTFLEKDEELMVVVASHMGGILENSRLGKQAELRASSLRQINEISQKVIGLNQSKQVAETAAKVIAEQFGHELVMVMLLDHKMDEFVAEGLGGVGAQSFPKGLRYGSHLGIPGEVMRTGSSVILQDVEQSENYIKILDWEPGSQICVPLKEGEEIIGLISVEYQVKNTVTENDLELLEALAAVLSSVMLYALKYEVLQKNVDQLEVVRQIALDISSDLDLNVMLKRVVNRVRGLLNARGAELGLVNESQNEVQIIVSENPWKDYSGYKFPLMSGVAGRIAAVGKPLVVPDFTTWGEQKSEDHRSAFTTVAGVPLKLSGEVIGTLVVQDDRPERSFTQEDMKVLELLSPQLTIFIRNARLYQELEERIEAQHLAESRLVQTAKLAAVGEMAAGVAHELNNPLTTVTGFAELILETMPKDSTEYEDMALILKEAHRARSVVRQLLDFSRQSDILRLSLDINEVLSAVLGLIHHQALTGKVEIRIEFWDGLPLVRVDRNQMQQVFLNLIHNAIQAMADGGELVVQSLVDQRDGEDWILVKIRDNGDGIDEAVLDQIFEPFFTTKESGQGTGLGLSVSYGIVSDHGGYIEVENNSGEGATFIVWLPVEIPIKIEGEQLNV